MIAYGGLIESGMNVHLLGDGRRVNSIDENGVYYPYGWARNLFQQREDMRIGADFDLTTQLDNNLLEIGFGIEQHTIRGYGNFAYTLAGIDPSLPDYVRFAYNQPWVFGYDVTGMEKTDSDYPSSLDWFADPDIGVHPTMAEFLRPRQPIIGYLYLQDKLELQDLVLNVGVRMDYFDIKSHEFVNPALPFGDPNNPNNLDLNKYDIGDFKIKDVEIEYSPRIGIGFPVTESTVFHAQYGRFIQLPELNLMYSGPFDPLGFNGSLISEETTSI